MADKNGWIPVSELPRQDEDVLAITDKGYYHAAYWARSADTLTPTWHKMDGGAMTQKVTHWQPLPAPPTSS